VTWRAFVSNARQSCRRVRADRAKNFLLVSYVSRYSSEEARRRAESALTSRAVRLLQAINSHLDPERGEDTGVAE